MDADGINNYIDYLLTQVNTPETNEKATIKTRRMWVIEQLGALIRSGSIPKSDGWIQSILDWLVIHGLFVIRKKSRKSPFLALNTLPSPPFSDELRQACRTRLLGCLGDLNAHATVVRSGEKSIKVPATASNGELWVSKVLTTIRALEHDTKHVSTINNSNETEIALRIKALDIVAQLKTVSQESAKGIELLLLGTVLQRYCQEPEDTDHDALEACIDAAKHMFPVGGRGKSTRKSSVGPGGATLEPIDVFVDTIIGFLEKSTTYLRTISNQSFSLLSASVRDTTIDLILAQLEDRDPAQLVEDDDDMEDQDEDQEADEELSSQPESKESEPNFDGDDDEEEEEEEEEKDADVELRYKILKALQASGIDATSDDEDEEELMDDEQMMAIDEQLAQVFRSRANVKKSEKSTGVQREATHFKNRVLDLVDIFAKKQPSSPHIIRLISPLVDLIAGTSSDERQLLDKAKGILGSRIGKYKHLPCDVETDQVFALLTAIHMRARRAHASDLVGVLNQCSVYLSKTLLHLGAEKSVLQIYRPSLTDFITRKNSALNTNFFQDFIRRCPRSAWHLRGDLLDLSTKAVNSYRQCQVYQLMEVLVNQLPAVGDIHQTEILEFMASLHKSC